MSWLAVAHRIPPELYYRYRLFEPERGRQAKWFLHWDEHNRLLAHLVRRQAPLQAARLEDKQSFARWCVENELPHPRTWALVERGQMHGELPPNSLFSKPADGFGGRGATGWNRDERGRYVGDGLVLDRSALIAELERRSNESPLMIQTRLHSHEDVRALDGDGLATLRLVTARPPGGGPVVLSAAFGMPMAGNSVDNFHAGGLCSAVDDDGRLGPAVRVLPEECLVRHRQHPDSGTVIEGVVLPWWKDAHALALRAHTLVNRLAFIGWDVVLTDEGPELLEANTVWDAAMPQVPEGLPLGRTDYLTWFLAHLDQCLSSSIAPNPSSVPPHRSASSASERGF